MLCIITCRSNISNDGIALQIWYCTMTKWPNWHDILVSLPTIPFYIMGCCTRGFKVHKKDLHWESVNRGGGQTNHYYDPLCVSVKAHLVCHSNSCFVLILALCGWYGIVGDTQGSYVSWVRLLWYSSITVVRRSWHQCVMLSCSCPFVMVWQYNNGSKVIGLYRVVQNKLDTF